jgi:hypothetical protein
MAQDFGDSNEPRRSLEEIGRLYQGKLMAAEYFLWLEQLAGIARINVNKSSHMVLQIEKSVNPVLIDQLYQSDEVPRFYSDYKHRLIAMDEMRRREANHQGTQHKPLEWPQKKEPNAMDIDAMKKKSNEQKRFRCDKVGHLVQNCPDVALNQFMEGKDF